MIKILNSKPIIILIFSFVLFPAITFAAKLYLEPSAGEYYQGDTFIVNARIDTEGECINTVEANLNFSQDTLEAADFSKGSSILSFWVKSPEVDNDSGTIFFAGGIPAGYCGRLPGDPGESNLLGKIIFQARKADGGPSSAWIKFLDSSRVLLNDGLGTPARLTTKGTVIKITGVAPLQIPKDEWWEELAKDKIPPEPFDIQINQDPLTFEGKYFITFQTQDKQTGIGYYEVKEGKRDWKIGDSPHLLNDQDLKSIIKVRAMDKAGNERIAEYAPAKPFPYWIIILILIIGAGAIWKLKKSKITPKKFL